MDTLPTSSNSASGAEQQKKYIRTFHGDVETIQKGGVPDLAPLNEPSPAATSPIKIPEPTPAPVPAPIPPSPMEPARPVVPQEPPHPSEAFGGEGKSSPLETYAGDFSTRMKDTKASAVTVLAAEQDLAPHPVQTQPPKFSRSSIIYSVAGGVLIIAGGVGAYLAYTTFIAQSVPIELAPTVTAPIFVDERQPVSGSGIALAQVIAQSVAKPIAQGSIRFLYFENATTTNTSVFSALQVLAPGALMRNIVASKSMAGVVNVSGVQSAFFILSVTAYSDTFAAMLQWEARMPRDLIKIFPPYPSQSAPVTTPVATTTKSTATTTPPAGRQATTSQSTPAVAPLPPVPAGAAGFIDTTIANHDVREYRDASGRSVLVYGYWNQTTLVIARDKAAFTEILGRLGTSRTK